MSGRRLRHKPRVNYYEPEEPPLDEYVFCEECGDYVLEYCAIHGPLLVIPDDKVPARPTFPSVVPRAALTIPRVFLHLAPSVIPGAGIGVFTTLTLPRGVRFGPYQGLTAHNVDSNYCWQIYDGNNKRSHVVDASDAQRSNWMRYVNCARHWAEQNLVAYQYKGQLYYRTIKIIPRFTELLVFYGSEFANLLNINLSKYNDSDYYHQILYTSSIIIENSEAYPTVANGEDNTANNDESDTSNNTEELLNFNEFQIIDENTRTIEPFETRIENDKIIINFLDMPAQENIVSKAKIMQFECNVCKKTFTKEKYLKVHALSHLDNPKYKCMNCPYTTSILYSFKRHNEMHARRKSFSCENCNFKTIFKNDFIKHCFEHDASTNIINRASYYSKLKSCELCDFNTYSRKCFQMHMIKHKGIIYQCQMCSYNNYSKVNYSNHLLRRHQYEK